MSSYKLTVPISLEVGVVKKRRYYLNLNVYRNLNFQVNNQLKRLFKTVIDREVKKLPKIELPVDLTFIIFYVNKRKFDLDNIGSIVCKFTNDALVEAGILCDDNYEYVKRVSFEFGGVDSTNPRCEVIIRPLHE